jgi:ABC-2 type transport system ATP-binding protein
MRVEPSSIYGFVGPNGAGKTTTMRIMATLIGADEGRCVIAGTDVGRQPASVRGRLGYMPDFFGVYDDLSVQEYLEFYAESYFVPARARKATIADLLELIDLGSKRDELVESLSRGMKQRLGLARCLVHDPDVLLLDEPASGMDPRARYEMREIVKELRQLGKTVLLSSHILPELAELCTHIGIVQDGRIIREGPVDEVLRGMNPGRAIEVRAFGAREAVVGVLAGHPDVTAVVEPRALGDATDADSLVPVTLIFRTFADDIGVRDVLGALVGAGIGVITYAAVRDNLEEVFMQLTDRSDAEGSA